MSGLWDGSVYASMVPPNKYTRGNNVSETIAPRWKLNYILFENRNY
jgi:hypothetical protein